MTPERLRKIEELYHSVQEASAEGRAALLDQADPELRREVESLLARRSDPQTVDHPVIEAAARLLGDETATVFNAGTRLGPYQVEHKIGEGGMGEVFRGLDTRLGRPVAIKVVHERFSSRFEREARAISSLNHPNICTLYDIGALPSSSGYLVMELLEGETIAARLKKGPLPADQAVQYAAQITSALAEAHERGIVHRDLKPGNIMLTKSGVKILDFGLATWEGDNTLTGSNMVMGTPAYMAPEQREGKPADARTDLYSFGSVFYEMLTGARAISDRKPVPSKTLEAIVSRCLETDPARRWQSANELAIALETALRPEKHRLWIASAAAIVVAFILAGYFFLRPAPKLTDKDTLVLADFVNTTGDPVFDDTLRQGLAIQLEQSPFLKIMDDGQLQRDLQLMSVPRGERITNQIAHEICVRDGAAATIDGSIARLGQNYVITLQASNCNGGATLAREQIQAQDKEHVLNAVGTAATGVRAKLGESLDSIQKLNRPLEEATTSSLEALQAYTGGYAEMGQGHFLAAAPLFQRAIALDPNFATAYHYLSISYNNAGDVERSREYISKAFARIDRVSPHERDKITAFYYDYYGELDKAVDAYRLANRNYPREWSFPNNLSVIFNDTGQFEDGLKEGLEAMRLEPDVEPPYRRLLDSYLCLDRIGDAKKLAPKVRALGIDGARIHQRFLEMAYVEGDQTAVAREIQWYAGKPVEYLSFGLQAAYRNVGGQRRESSKLYHRAAETALRQGLRNVANEFEDADARADALSGNCPTAHGLGRPALALALCGDSARAEKLAAGTSKVSANETIWNAVQLPEIRAAMEIKDHPDKAVELLASASPYERAYPEVPYLRGLAYLRLKKGAEAAAEFQKIGEHKGANWGSTWQHPNWGQYYALSYLGIARGLALAGDPAKARKAFQDFFELWKDADPDIPILKQAKAEYAKL